MKFSLCVLLIKAGGGLVNVHISYKLSLQQVLYKDRRAELTNYATREIDRTKPKGQY